MSIQTELRESFARRYGTAARVYRAPGRINLIGEHTDYNDGFVLPAAISFYTWVAVAPREDRKLSLYSENFLEVAELDLDDCTVSPREHWSNYVRGVALVLGRAGYRLRGANLVIRGDIPMGAGLSSSAALEVAVGSALLAVSKISVSRVELAQLCQRAENEFAGARCGIMDQFASCHGTADHAILLDCRSLEYRSLPLPSDLSLVACNTMTKHKLAGGEYNKRRAECEEGTRLLATVLPHVRALRDVSLADFQQHSRELPELIYKRCRHVITENDRVTKAVASLKSGDLAGFGQLMTESHRSLRDDFEVSCAELDLMVELASKAEGVYGARMTGGGFGGCTINLVRSDRVDQFCNTVASHYKQKTGQNPEIYVSRAAASVEEVRV